MNKVKIVIGLPGSGKSTLINHTHGGSLGMGHSKEELT